MSERYKRIVMTIVGVMTTGFSVGIFNFTAFGMDPFQVMAHGVWYHVNLGFGNFYTILNLLMFIGVLIVDRKKIGLGTLINMFLLGYVIEWSSWLFITIMPSDGWLIRFIMLIIGIIIISFGSALYFTADMGVSTYDAVALILAERTPIKFYYLRISTDLICTITGFVLGATVGIGTVITAFFMGPIIAFFNRTVAIPLRYGKSSKEGVMTEDIAKVTI